MRRYFIFILILSIIGVFFSQWLIYYYAPLEESMGFAQKIFYLHLPMAFWCLISYSMIFIFSIYYLVKREEKYDFLCRAFAETGTLFATLALLTGIIWARISWGIWWTWDPRLTTTLVMWFIYIGYLIIENLDMTRQVKATTRAITGIIAFADVPLVFLSARVFRSIHPAVFASSEGGLEPEMAYTLLSCLTSIGLFWICLCILRVNQMRSFSIYKKIQTTRILSFQ